MGFAAASRNTCLDLVPGLTNGRGFDHVLIRADTTSDDPVELAGQIARDRGTAVARRRGGHGQTQETLLRKELVFKTSAGMDQVGHRT